VRARTPVLRGRGEAGGSETSPYFR
jgi:hypothetical protein